MKRFSLVAALAGLLMGCSSGPSEIDVAGKVTLDGQPVGADNEALIRFEPTDGKGKSAEGYVVKGEYAVRVAPGSYQVAITWNRPTGKKVSRPGVQGPGSEKDEIVEEIPAKFNTATTLKADVAADKKQHDFALAKK